MDIRYMNYVTNKTPYYFPRQSNDEEDLFVIKDIPENYEVIDGEHWINMLNRTNPIPKQGWKIHISSIIDEAQKTLDIVSNILFKNNISFKYVRSKFELTLKNSKYGDREASGKFITIYPETNEKFIELMNILKVKLKDQKNGPYILNDKRWYDSNIYFRYGGFIFMYIIKNGRKVPAIQDSIGNYHEDIRAPYYHLPEFIKEPKEVVEMEREMNQLSSEESVSPLDNLEITEALHFSNGGGVYIASEKNGKKMILKEGRPNSGLDAQNRDAYNRIKNEGHILNKLVDNKFVVDLYDCFDVWEHTFILEEYIPGSSLYTWWASNYPFYAKDKIESYIESAITILNQLIASLQEIHEFGIGLGDLQPSNIIISSNEKIKLIDFETASTKLDSVHSGLMTLGFSGDLNMTREQSDWFALYRIARQFFIPIGPVQDISNNIEKVHDRYIKQEFGDKAYNIVEKIHKIALDKDAKPQEDFFETRETLNNKFEIKNSLEKLRDGILKDANFCDEFILGDIRQHILDGGKFNAMTGSFGVIMSLFRTGELNNDIFEWVENLDINYLKQLDDGLLTGKSGISSILYELGYKEKAKELLNTIEVDSNESDISLSSGLSGIGLFYIDFFYSEKDSHYLHIAEDIGDILSQRLEENVEIIPFDDDIVDKGLISGWSGVSLFYTVLFNITKNQKWLNLSKKALDKDLELGIFDEEKAYHIDDGHRLFPYLAGGSAGLIIALLEYNITTREKNLDKELMGFAKIAESKSFYNCGLYRGTTGILATSSLIDDYQNNQDITLTQKTLNILALHLLENEKYIYVPGDSCYRLSGDVFSGSAGLLLVLNDIKEKKHLSWLPIINRKKMFGINQK